MPDDEFVRDQQAYVELVKTVGYDNLPLNSETWRPLMNALWRAAELHKLKVWAFDISAHPGRLYNGLRGPPKKVVRCADDLQAALLGLYTRDELKAAHPMIVPGPPTSLYFEGVWTPKAALPSRRN